MPANSIQQGATATGRQTGERLLAYFGSNRLTSPHWYCQDVDYNPGPTWSKAVVNVGWRAQGGRESAPAVALNLDGPLGKIMPGTPLEVVKVWPGGKEVVFNGVTIQPESNLDQDALAVTAYDMRFRLREVRIVGRYVWDPLNSELTFQQGWDPHFNPGGRPICIFDDDGNPQFAPHADYGLDPDEAPPSPDEGHTSKACDWTFENLLKYLRNHYGPDAEASTEWPAIGQVDGRLIWPETLGAEVDRDAVANFNSAVGQNNTVQGQGRKGRDIQARGVSLLDLFEEIFFSAGGWTLGEKYKGEMKSELCVQPTAYKGDGISLYYKAGGDSDGKALITGGTFFEDGEDLATLVWGTGALVFIEKLLSQDVADELVEATTSAEFNAWRKSIVDFGNSPSAIDEANRKHLWAACTYKISPNHDYQAGTAFANFPRAKINRPPWTRGLTLRGEGEAGSQDFAGMTWPIYTEVKVGSTWTLGPLFDGLDVYENGMIHLPVLREYRSPVRSWKWNNNPFDTVEVNGQTVADISMQKIRMNLAIPCDHRISFAALLQNETLNTEDFGGGFAEKSYQSPDVSRIAEGYTVRKYIDLGDLHELHLRMDSIPQPQAAGGLGSDFPDKPGLTDALPDLANAVRSDYATLQAFMRKRLVDEGRNVKGGLLRSDGCLLTVPRPGQAIDRLVPVGGTGGGFPARCVILGYRLMHNGSRDGSGSTNTGFLKIGTYSLARKG